MGKCQSFTNDFKDSLGDFQFKDSLSSENVFVDMGHRTIFYPSASLQGELCKKWIVQNGRRYMIKANYGITCQQSINEAIASLLHEKQQKVPYTRYKLCDIEVEKEKAIGCACEDFCTEEIEFIPAYEVVESAEKRNEQSEYEHFISLLLKYVKDAFVLDRSRLPSKEEVRELLLLDCKNAERCEAILEGYEGKKELLRRFQEGEKIYQYGYRV